MNGEFSLPELSTQASDVETSARYAGCVSPPHCSLNILVYKNQENTKGKT